MLPYLHRSRPKRTPPAEGLDHLSRELRRDVEVLANDIGPRGYFAPEPLRYEHYHAPTDTPEKLDYTSMARVVTGVAEMTRALIASL